MKVDSKDMSWERNIWREGEVLDFWSVPHLLAGALLAALGHYLGLAFWQVAIPSLVLLIGWEFFEMARGIDETVPNRIMDVVLGVAGFALMIAVFVSFDGNVAFSATAVVLFLWAVLNIWGFMTYLRKRR